MGTAPKLDNYPLTPFREALTSTTGVIVSAIFVSWLSGNLISLVAYWNRGLPDPWETIELPLIYWGINGLGVWGFGFAIIHIWVIHNMLRGRFDPYFSLAVLFCNQAIVSSIALFIMGWSNGIYLSIASVLLVGASAFVAYKFRSRNFA